MRHRRDPWGSRLLRGAKKLAKWTFILALLGLVGLYGFVRYDFASAAGELDRHVETARHLGLPLTPEDMRHAPVAADENAAPLYREIAEQFAAKKKDLEYREVAEAQKVIFLKSAGRLPEFQSLSGHLDPILARAVEASQRKSCDFERDWDLGPYLVFTEFASLKNVVKWLSFRAVYRARTGEFEAALTDLAAADRVGAHLIEDKVLISGLVRISCDVMVMRAINAIATFHERDSDRLARLADVVKSFSPVETVVPFLRSEAFWGYWTSLNLDRYGRMHPKEIDEAWGHGDMGFMGMGIERWRVFPPLIPTHLVEEAYASRSLEFWNEMMALHREKNWKSRELSFELDRRARRFETSTRPCDAIGAILFPVFAQAGTAFEKMEATRQSTLALIEALRFRNRTGAWPKDLDQIGFEIDDPYSGKPIRYTAGPEGFRIYTVYADGKDDGGKFAHQPSGNAEGRDLVLAAHPVWDLVAPLPSFSPPLSAPSEPPPIPIEVR